MIMKSTTGATNADELRLLMSAEAGKIARRQGEPDYYLSTNQKGLVVIEAVDPEHGPMPTYKLSLEKLYALLEKETEENGYTPNVAMTTPITHPYLLKMER